MGTNSPSPHGSHLGELLVILNDRKRLARLMLIQGVSQRQLAEAAGWRSHSYLGRLMRGDVKTLDKDAALRIAHHLHVGYDDLFVTKVSTTETHNVHPEAPRTRRRAS